MSNWLRRKKKKPKPEISDEMHLWLAKNRGALTEIANTVRPFVTPQFVCMVARRLRKSKDGKVERMLKEKGAPL